jgi:hypothetical protein
MVNNRCGTICSGSFSTPCARAAASRCPIRCTPNDDRLAPALRITVGGVLLTSDPSCEVPATRRRLGLIYTTQWHQRSPRRARDNTSVPAHLLPSVSLRLEEAGASWWHWCSPRLPLDFLPASRTFLQGAILTIFQRLPVAPWTRSRRPRRRPMTRQGGVPPTRCVWSSRAGSGTAAHWPTTTPRGSLRYTKPHGWTAVGCGNALHGEWALCRGRTAPNCQ